MVIRVPLPDLITIEAANNWGKLFSQPKAFYIGFMYLYIFFSILKNQTHFLILPALSINVLYFHMRDSNKYLCMMGQA